MLKMAVIKETKEKETRVSVTPETIKKLHYIGVKVAIQSDAGVLSGFDNAAYLQAGAEVVSDKEKLYKNAQIVCWFKRPKNYIDEIKYIPRFSTLIGFLDPFVPDNKIKSCSDRELTCFTWELMPDIEKFQYMHAFSKMGVLAGRAACRCGIKRFYANNSARRPLSILIIGTGNVALAAAEEAFKEQHYLHIAGTNSEKKDYIKNFFKADFLSLKNNDTDKHRLLRTQQKQLLAGINHCQPDVIITSARRYGLPAPILLNESCLSALAPGSVIEDLTASVGGNTIVTKYGKDVRTSSGVLVCNRSNYPRDIPQQASQVYSDCLLNLLRYLEPYKKQSIAKSLWNDTLLKKAIIK